MEMNVPMTVNMTYDIIATTIRGYYFFLRGSGEMEFTSMASSKCNAGVILPLLLSAFHYSRNCLICVCVCVYAVHASKTVNRQIKT